MSPGGHLVTTVAACGAAAATTDSWPLVAGLAAGGFWIDIDHAIDYVLVERQRDLRPGAFLRYYVNGLDLTQYQIMTTNELTQLAHH